MRSVAAFIVALIAVSPALAASDAVWDAFRKDVADACLAKAAPLFEKVTAEVDPFGSESYGLALLTGLAKGSADQVSSICVYDKRTKAVEVGGELPKP